MKAITFYIWYVYFSTINNTNHAFVLFIINKVIIYETKGGKSFYQFQSWASIDHVHMFTSPHLNKWNQLFLYTILNKIIEVKGSWNASLESNVINEIIKLLVNGQGKPDWNYMENYIRNKI